jgi:hypothetical protein
VTSQSQYTDPEQLLGGVDLSALYIVDNNLAPILSESYGACEADLGTTGNAFYNTLWQQAAAEGITVDVAAGDTGSAGCDPTSGSPDAAVNGLAVGGNSSTPYNVSVGGTMFNQAGNFGNYWNSTNTPVTQASALGYISELPWDDSVCAANYPTACTSVDSGGADLTGGGGGASQVFSKPAFQTGLTPADSVRDVPDVALFASDSFIDGSFYVVCESDLNTNGTPCTADTSGGITFQGVGGTSGSTPAFSAIIALVNQSQATGGNPTPRQGNANFVLYALGAQEATNSSNWTKCNSSSFTNPGTPAPAYCVFNDITTGNNAVACVGGSTNCSAGASSPFGVLVSGVAVDNGNPAYQAVAGYDLAVGLGSINVTNLVASWSNASRTTTTTSLSAGSGSNTSGQTFTATVTVSPTPVGASGTESVALNAYDSTQTNILGSFGPFTLNGASASVSTNLLPPGTAFLQATYGGDVTLASSVSSFVPVAVSGANYSTKIVLSFVTADSNNNPQLSQSSQKVPYGSFYQLQVAVSNGNSCAFAGTSTAPTIPCPKGTVAFTDNGNPLNDFPSGTQVGASNTAKLNNNGIAEDQPVDLPVGSHSVVAAYTSSDTNYSSGSSNTLNITIQQASTTTLVGSSALAITSGTSVTLTAYVTTSSLGVGPTGSVVFTNGSTNLGSVNCTSVSGTQNTTPPIAQINAGTAYCVVNLTTAISSLYPAPPVGGPRTPWLPIISALLSLLLFALGFRFMPQARRRAYAYAGLVGIALLVGVVAGCGGGGGGSSGGNRTITAAYAGDTNYTSSNGTVGITVQ